MVSLDKKIIPRDVKFQFKYDKIVPCGDFLYKKSPNSERKMEHLNDASSKFIQDAYILAEYLLYDENFEKYVGFAMNNYNLKCYGEYQTVKDLELQKSFINREIMIRKLVLALIELRKNGFIYTDIHFQNILVSGDLIKLADMDHVKESTAPKDIDIFGSTWCLMDFIIQVYFYDNLVQDEYVFDRFMMGWDGLANSGMLTKEVNDYLMKVLNSDESMLSYDLYEMTELIIKEFSDQEKVKAIKKLTQLP